MMIPCSKVCDLRWIDPNAEKVYLISYLNVKSHFNQLYIHDFFCLVLEPLETHFSATQTSASRCLICYGRWGKYEFGQPKILFLSVVAEKGMDVKVV